MNDYTGRLVDFVGIVDHTSELPIPILGPGRAITRRELDQRRRTHLY